MTPPTTHTGPVPPWGLAVAAMLSVQLGSALSVPLISTAGPAGTAWLRLSMGAVILLALARPPLRAVRRHDVPTLIGLGVTTGLVTISFLAAIERIPLGTAVAIEFLGPLTVAAVGSHSRRALVWPALALAGVVLLTQPWRGDVNPAGVAFAGLAAIGWASYILLTQRVGDRFTGVGALSLTVPIAAVTAAVMGIPQAAGQLSVSVLAAAAGLAVLLPVLPFTFELLALRHMTHAAFGTLMALEPAIGVLLGLLVLHQKPAAAQLVGILLVVLAGAAAQRGGRRRPRALERNHATPSPDPSAHSTTVTPPKRGASHVHDRLHVPTR
jgi:inner membrane transporter RhtA